MSTAFAIPSHERPACACSSEKHGDCPDPVAWAVKLNDNEMWLCQRCYDNAKAGAYGPKVKILAAIPISIFCQSAPHDHRA